MPATALTSPPTASTVEEVAAGTTVVIDTCVLVSRPDALEDFGPADVVLPLRVVEELDGLKVRQDEVGWAARETLRRVEELRVAGGGSLSDRVALPGGGTLRVQANGLHLEGLITHGFDIDKADNRILASALGIASRAGGAPVVVVSNDAAMRLKAAHLGLRTASHGAVSEPAFSDGWVSVEVHGGLLDDLGSGGVDVEAFAAAAGLDQAPPVNTFVAASCGSQSLLGRVHHDGVVRRIRERPGGVYGLQPRSKEQRFALDLLMDPDVKLVCVTGKAGTGKTLLALAAGLQQVVEEPHTYQQVGVFRPPVAAAGADLGFLPGSLDEKLEPWVQPIMDNLMALTGDGTLEAAQQTREYLQERQQLVFGSLAHLRGRSLSGLWAILDEGQNAERSSIRLLLTRLVEGSKVVLVGDVDQIDSPYLSKRSNGLSAVISAFQGHRSFGHVHLTRGERGEIADLATELL